MDEIKLYDLAPSPNNMKARIALNFKELPFTRIPVEGGDRAEVLKVSGQPRTPVLVHGKTVIFDSGAILRYLDANFRDTRPLFSAEYDEMGKIETWELLGRSALTASVGATFGQFFAETKDPAVAAWASSNMHENTAKIEEALASGDWLLGNRMTAADVSCAPMVFYAMVPDAVAASHPIAKFFADTLKLGDGRDRTRAWAMRVMAYDR